MVRKYLSIFDKQDKRDPLAKINDQNILFLLIRLMMN